MAHDEKSLETYLMILVYIYVSMNIGSTVYSCTFFQEINDDQSFHVP